MMNGHAKLGLPISLTHKHPTIKYYSHQDIDVEEIAKPGLHQKIALQEPLGQ